MKGGICMPRKDVVLYATTIAKELRYPKEVINAIKNATSETEITKILHTARLSQK